MIANYYTYDQTTLEVDHLPKKLIRQSKMDEFPASALLVEPLEATKGKAVLVCDFDENGRPKSTKYVEDNRGKTVYYKQAPTQSKVVTQLGVIEDGWTLKKPATQFDKWDSQLDDWVTDLQAKYEYDYQQVNIIRGSLYSQIVDRLNSEAEMIRRTEGNEAKALDYEAQADAAYMKIREDNPWPLPPEA